MSARAPVQIATATGYYSRAPGCNAFDVATEGRRCRSLRAQRAARLAGFRTFGDTLRSGRLTINETPVERHDASAIYRLTPRRSCEDDRDGASTREQAHSARLR